jgi:Leucine-rich repeat (LRR) protein
MYVDRSNQNLTYVPSDILNDHSITILDLSNNQITELPEK